MEAFSPKQRLILVGMKSNSLPKIAKVNVEQHTAENDGSSTHSDSNNPLVILSRPGCPRCEQVKRAQSLYTVMAPGSNAYRSNTLVNLFPSTSRTTQLEYDILEPSEENVPPTPSISVSELATGPGSKSSWRIGIMVMAALFIFILLTVIILCVYFVKKDAFVSSENLLGCDFNTTKENGN